MSDRLAWMNKLKADGKFIDGAPLLPEGLLANEHIEEKFVHTEDSVNGYVIVEVEDIDAVLDLTQTAPQLWPDYGSAQAEIRQLQPIN